MSDPAVEAAIRVWGFREGHFFEPKTTGGYSVAAAREALKPIRELHHKDIIEKCGPYVCVEDGYEWPCDTAKLIYPESEL